MTQHLELDQKLFEEFLEFFNNRVPDPNMYPHQYEFMIKSFLFHKKYQIKESDQNGK
jgi:hypothetical protein